MIVQRQKFPHAMKVRSKFVAKVKNVLVLANHFARKVVNGTEQFTVDPKDGLSYHYRENCIPHSCTKKNRMYDMTARKFHPQIWDNVNEVCKAVFKDGICP